MALENDKNSDIKEDIIKCFENAISTLTCYNPVSLCHYDLNLNNILFHKSSNTLKIIDWEYICVGDPLLDITAIVNNLKLSKQQESFFFDCYRSIAKNKKLVIPKFDNNKIDQMKQLNHSILELWEYAQ